jgi:hypothetical protein
MTRLNVRVWGHFDDCEVPVFVLVVDGDFDNDAGVVDDRVGGVGDNFLMWRKLEVFFFFSS